MKKISIKIATSAALLLQLATVDVSACFSKPIHSDDYILGIRKNSQREIKRAGGEKYESKTVKHHRPKIQSVSIPNIKYPQTIIKIDDWNQLNDFTSEDISNAYACHHFGISKISNQQLTFMAIELLSRCKIQGNIIKKKQIIKSDGRRRHNIGESVLSNGIKIIGGLDYLSFNNYACIITLFNNLCDPNFSGLNDVNRREDFNTAFRYVLNKYNKLMDFMETFNKKCVKLSNGGSKLNSDIMDFKLKHNSEVYLTDLMNKASKFESNCRQFLGTTPTKVVSLLHDDQNYSYIYEVSSSEYEMLADNANREFEELKSEFESLKREVSEQYQDDPVEHANPFVMTTEASTTGYTYQQEQEEAERRMTDKNAKAKSMKDAARAHVREAYEERERLEAWSAELIKAAKEKIRAQLQNKVPSSTPVSFDYPPSIQHETERVRYRAIMSAAEGSKSIEYFKKELDEIGFTRNGLNLEQISHKGRKAVSLRFNQQYRFVIYLDNMQIIFTNHYK